jgi:hypothetical protein
LSRFPFPLVLATRRCLPDRRRAVLDTVGLSRALSPH